LPRQRGFADDLIKSLAIGRRFVGRVINPLVSAIVAWAQFRLSGFPPSMPDDGSFTAKKAPSAGAPPGNAIQAWIRALSAVKILD